MIAYGVDLVRVESFVFLRHSEAASRSPMFGHADPNEVGQYALKIAKRLNAVIYDKHAIQKLHEVRAAGMLVYSLERYGCVYDDLVELAGIGTAELVANASCDPRLQATKRGVMLCSTLGQGTIYSQIVRLAEIICSVKRLSDSLLPEGILAHDTALKAWIHDRLGWVDSMSLLSSNSKVRPYASRANKYLIDFDNRRVHIRKEIADRYRYGDSFEDVELIPVLFELDDAAMPEVVGAYSGDFY